MPSEVINDINLALPELYVTSWQEEVNKEDSIRGTGQNKLTTHCTFKQYFSTEQYLKLGVLLQSFDVGWLQSVQKLDIMNNQFERTENACYAQESEEHVILKCNAYADIRDDLFAHIRIIYPHFNNLSHSNKLSFIISSHLTTAQRALICHNILQRRRNLKYQ